VNAFGDVTDGQGGVLAGARGADGEHADTLASLADGPDPAGWSAGENTTLLVVATDRPVSRSGLRSVARQAMNAVTRRVVPSGTLFDGDVAFAISTGGLPGDGSDAGREGSPPGSDPGELVALGAAAQVAAERALERAVTAGDGPTPDGGVR
jgi:D-aminopeptidase